MAPKNQCDENYKTWNIKAFKVAYKLLFIVYLFLPPEMDIVLRLVDVFIIFKLYVHFSK